MCNLCISQEFLIWYWLSKGIYEPNLTGEVNLALNRPATQSSTYPGCEAGKAVDGIDNDGDLLSLSTTQTYDYAPWWKVRLEHPILVYRVEITNAYFNRMYAQS